MKIGRRELKDSKEPPSFEIYTLSRISSLAIKEL